jgi:hypothetical protein
MSRTASAYPCCFLDLIGPRELLRPGVRVIHARATVAASVSALRPSISLRRVSCRAWYITTAAFSRPGKRRDRSRVRRGDQGSWALLGQTPLTCIYVKLRNAATCDDPRPMLDVQSASAVPRRTSRAPRGLSSPASLAGLTGPALPARQKAISQIPPNTGTAPIRSVG